MKKVPSPGSKRKSNKTFGVILDELMKREQYGTPGAIVPGVVCKICDYILSNGLQHEGIFRISGSARVVDRIRTSFDKSGDANLQEDHDIMAVASCLKLFLRELPVPVIPESLTDVFLQLENDYGEADISIFISNLLPLLSQLPHHHYNLLEYLTDFLLKVSCFESSNKMHANALAIVFGPNIFRCGAGMSGLHDQAVTNKIIHKLITNYDDIFIVPNTPRTKTNVIKVEETISPRTPPPRPPPPKIVSSSPIPSPRMLIASEKTKSHIANGSIPNGHVTRADPGSNQSLRSPALRMISPRLSDEESGRGSPFVLDSENGHSVLESPVIPPAATQMVERTINKAICEHMFGDMDASTTASSLDDIAADVLDSDTLVESVPQESPRIQPLKLDMDIQSPRPKPRQLTQPTNQGLVHIAEPPMKVVLKPDVKNNIKLDRASPPQRPSPPLNYQPTITNNMSSPSNNKQASTSTVGENILNSEKKNEPAVAVNDLIKQFQQKSQSSNNDLNYAKLRKNPRPVSSPASMSQNTSPVIGEKPHIKNDRTKQFDSDSKNSLDRVDGKNNGSPRLGNIGKMDWKTDGKNVTSIDVASPRERRRDRIMKTVVEIGSGDSAGSSPRSGVMGDSGKSSPRTVVKGNEAGDSPRHGNSVVPKLDLTALHQQVSSHEAKTAEKGFSPHPGHISLYTNISVNVTEIPRAKQRDGVISNEAPLSPRAYETPYDYSVPLNTDMPPSPPTNQESYHLYSVDDEYSNSLKQLNKRIHSVKRKMKLFEDNFQKENGYKMSQREKSSNTEVRKYIIELNKHKKDVKRLKENTPSHNRNPMSVPTLDDIDSNTETPSLHDTLDDLLTRLKNKRIEAGRPQDISLMSGEQVQEEKLAVQKALLQFESLHGRPTSRDEKDIMRPLYDRYRTIKRAVTKSGPLNVELDLQTVPEDHTIDPRQSTNWGGSVRIPTGTTDDFTVTRDMGLLRETMRPMMIENLTPDIQTPDDQEFSSRLHTLSTPELHQELDSVNRDKKQLRKILRQYEDDFYRENGRKVQKEDRIPLSGEYLDYKRVKARLKLLEVLLSKR